ncbi:MAG: hypothetical protein HZA14_12370 [Nitrospirae bacterium]|nr:hypothetical protein [Nitrospirota bacterium]
MTANKLILSFIITLGIIALFVSVGVSHNNSAPNFECIQCHEGGMGDVEIKLEGLPEKYVPGKTYKMTLTVVSENESLGDVAGGFAVEASAGELIVVDKKNTQLSDGILTHTKEGSALRKWVVGWKAPSQKIETDLSVMAVAANGDFSTAGDVIGADGFSITPGK